MDAEEVGSAAVADGSTIVVPGAALWEARDDLTDCALSRPDIIEAFRKAHALERSTVDQDSILWLERKKRETTA